MTERPITPAAPWIWVHGAPARNIEQVVAYLSGDAHDQSKVEFYDGKQFHDLVIEKR